VPCWQHHHAQRYFVGIPQAFTVTAAHAHVGTGRHVAVGGDAAAGIHLDPALVEAFQQVGSGCAAAPSSPARPARLRSFVGRFQHQCRTFLGGQFGRRQRALVQPHGADDQRCAVRPVVQAARVDDGHAGGGAEQQVALLGFVLAPMKKVRNARPSARDSARACKVLESITACCRGRRPDAADGSDCSAMMVPLDRPGDADAFAEHGLAERVAAGHDADAAAIGADPQAAARSMASELMMASDSASGLVALALICSTLPLSGSSRFMPLRVPTHSAPSASRASVDAVIGQAAAFLRPWAYCTSVLVAGL
jgi:hypothetical protein